MSARAVFAATLMMLGATVVRAESEESKRDSWADWLAIVTARDYYIKGRLDEAETQLRSLAKRKALDADGLTLAGDILRERGQWLQAETAFRAAIAAEPERAELHLRLGQALQEQQKADAADVEFARYVELTQKAQP